MVQRTVSKGDDSATEDDISRWLIGGGDANGESTLKETLTLHMEDTQAHGRIAKTSEPTEEADLKGVADSAPVNGAENSDDSAQAEGQSGGWSLFKRGKPGTAKPKPGKLPPRPAQQSKDSREAAADIIREMQRRR
jgi:hypothetical protein